MVQFEAFPSSLRVCEIRRKENGRIENEAKVKKWEDGVCFW